MDQKPKYTLQADGTRLYPDGSVRNEHGHWITRPPGSADLITSENARDMRALYEAQVAEQVRANLPPARMGKIAGVQAELAESGQPQASTQAARFVFQAAGHHAFVRHETSSRQQGLTITVAADGADAISSLLDRLGPPPSQVVDAEYTEVD